MPATFEHDGKLLHMQDKSPVAARDAANEFPQDAFNAVRGMVNGLVASLMFWAVTLYLLLK